MSIQKIKTVMDLKSAIEQLEYKQSAEWPLLKEQFLITYENLKPLNVLKKAFKEVTSTPVFTGDMLSTAIGLTAGYLSKSIVVGVSHNPIKKLLGELLGVGISNIVSKNSDTIKLMAGKAVSFFSKKKEL